MQKEGSVKLRIREVAKMKKMNMIELSAKSGVLPNMLSYYNTGAVQPPLSKLVAIAEALECDILELIETTKPGFAHFYIDGEYQGVRK